MTRTRRELLRTFGLTLGGLALGGSLSGCALWESLYGKKPQDDSGAEEPPVATQTVEIVDFEFVPAVIRVTVGTTVTWINRDRAAHTATSTNPSGVFDSGSLAQDERFEFEFTAPGTYEYFCSIHPWMTGKVIVEA